MTHEIKILESFADAVASGEKTFEVREKEEAKTEVENALKFIYTREHTAEVLEALSVEPQDHTDEKYSELMKQYKHLRKYASDLETKLSVEQTEWISVKDSRKPKIKERVWVTDCDGEVWIMYYNDCDCYFNEFGDVFADDIIAWQPITEPSPYKGGGITDERDSN